MGNPKISVIIGIYNCESTLEESLNSLMAQTFQNFEVIVCDDGSKDETYNLAKSFSEKYPAKFVLLTNDRNMGLNYTLNKCLEKAKGEYIARMDGDDISISTRFEKQIQFLETNHNMDIVSSAMIYFDESGDWGISRPKEKPQPKDLIKGTPFAHAPCMVRKEAYAAVKGYSVKKRLLRVEDYHLWTKMYSIGLRGYNIQEPLYKMRDDKNAEKRRTVKNRINEVYVKYLIIRLLKLPFYNYLYVIRPLIVGIIPESIYKFLHQQKLRGN